MTVLFRISALTVVWTDCMRCASHKIFQRLLRSVFFDELDLRITVLTSVCPGERMPRRR